MQAAPRTANHVARVDRSSTISSGPSDPARATRAEAARQRAHRSPISSGDIQSSRQGRLLREEGEEFLQQVSSSSVDPGWACRPGRPLPGGAELGALPVGISDKDHLGGTCRPAILKQSRPIANLAATCEAPFHEAQAWAGIERIFFEKLSHGGTDGTSAGNQMENIANNSIVRPAE